MLTKMDAEMGVWRMIKDPLRIHPKIKVLSQIKIFPKIKDLPKIKAFPKTLIKMESSIQMMHALKVKENGLRLQRRTMMGMDVKMMTKIYPMIRVNGIMAILSMPPPGLKMEKAM